MDHQAAGLDPLQNINGGFELHDFRDVPNFDKFVDLMNGQNEDPLAVFNQFGPIPNPEADQSSFGFDATILADPTSLHITLPDYDGGIMVEDDENDEEDSAGTITTPTDAGKRPKVDRSRTLVSERTRRGRMKKKLYALRSLVPNITKVRKTMLYICMVVEKMIHTKLVLYSTPMKTYIEARLG